MAKASKKTKITSLSHKKVSLNKKDKKKAVKTKKIPLRVVKTVLKTSQVVKAKSGKKNKQTKVLNILSAEKEVADNTMRSKRLAGIVKEEEVLVTEEGLRKLKEELDILINIKRKEVADRLKEAISYGDLSENSEYEAIKYEQAFIEGRIAELELKIKNAKIIKDSSALARDVQIGSTVVISNVKAGEDETYTIVGSTEADPLSGKISNESPIGQALLNKKVGEVIEVYVPEGKAAYRIKKIS